MVSSSVHFLICFQYYNECHGVIYVVDASDRGRLEESRLAFGMMIIIVVLMLLLIIMMMRRRISVLEVDNSLISLIFKIHD
jgi:hypothetical protein